MSDDEKDELDGVETISREQALKEMQQAIRNLRKHTQTDNVHPAHKSQKNASKNTTKDRPADTEKTPGEPEKN
jgi:hypothetical protein